MKSRLALILSALLVICVAFSACTVPAADTADITPPREERQPATHSVTPANTMIPSATQKPPITPQYSEEISGDSMQQQTDWPISEAGPDFSACVLPQSIPEISEEDMRTFNPDKTVDYLVEGLQHQYYIQQAELVGGTLYITVLDNLYTEDINYEYEYLKETFSLEDDMLLDLPVFSGCVIHDGTMYASEAAWQDRQQYESYEDWIYSREYAVNEKTLGSKILASLPVAEDAKIYLLTEGGFEYYELTPQQFIEYPYFIHDVEFSYENDCITAICEVYYP